MRCTETQSVDHEWDGCKCKRCGERRDQGHKWNGPYSSDCSRCGKWCDHDWESCNDWYDRCRICGCLERIGVPQEEIPDNEKHGGGGGRIW